MFTTFIKHPTIPSFVVGAALGAVAVFRYNRHMQIFRSNIQELAEIDATIERLDVILERHKVLKNKLREAGNDYWDMKNEYGSFFSVSPNLPEHYKYMWRSELPEVIALQSFMPYAHKELLRLEDGEVFEEAEAQEYLMIIDVVRKTFDKAVSAAKAAVEDEKQQNKVVN